MKKKSKTGFTDEVWVFDPRVMENIEKARADKIKREEKRKAIDSLTRHNFSSSGERYSNEDANGVRYEAFGNDKVVHDIFRFFGAGYKECWKVVRQPDGIEVRTRIDCEKLKPLSWDKKSGLYVHPSLRTPEEKRKHWETKKKTIDEIFIDKLTETLPNRFDQNKFDEPPLYIEKHFPKKTPPIETEKSVK